jgi:hypothetical protein
MLHDKQISIKTNRFILLTQPFRSIGITRNESSISFQNTNRAVDMPLAEWKRLVSASGAIQQAAFKYLYQAERARL